MKRNIMLSIGSALLLLPCIGFAEQTDVKTQSSGETITWSDFQTLSASRAERLSRATSPGQTTPLTSTTGAIRWSEIQPVSAVKARQTVAPVPRTDTRPAPSAATGADAATSGGDSRTITWSKAQPLSQFQASRAAADKASRDALPAAATSTAPPISDTARFQELQRYLLYFGYDIGDADGIPDDRMFAALQSWQRSRAMTPDATVSETLLNTMAVEINAATSDTP